MNDLLKDYHNAIFTITLNRLHKHNAFDDKLLLLLQEMLDEAIQDPKVKVIVLRANGNHFCAGADLDWMRRMAQFSEAENLADALILANVMKTLYESSKPTIAVVQGSAFGGGAGLVCACDIAIAAHNARFCFSEVKLGLIPAVISPYVINAIGERAAKWLFMSAGIVLAPEAKQLNMVQHCVKEEELGFFARDYAERLSALAPEAVKESKTLVAYVGHQPMNDELVNHTAHLIAKKRVSREGQIGLRAFLDKKIPDWNQG